MLWFNTSRGKGTPSYCLRFAHPAEADWRPEAGKLGRQNFKIGLALKDPLGESLQLHSLAAQCQGKHS